jgi:putative endonuclease
MRSATPTRRGHRAERRAAWHYRLRGYRILDTNAWAGGNELDVVARRGRKLVFVEVKEKRGEGFGGPAEMVGPEKQRRLRSAAEAWLARHPEHDGLEGRFDVIAVSGGRLQLIEDAF